MAPIGSGLNWKGRIKPFFIHFDSDVDVDCNFDYCLLTSPGSVAQGMRGKDLVSTSQVVEPRQLKIRQKRQDAWILTGPSVLTTRKNVYGAELMMINKKKRQSLVRGSLAKPRSN
ncbi:predicted protein [Histoplasma capsulatum G186AR]|uniref:Uncharacterized protein n=1 Tax=Ajellomyces capsulatus (strain G186AR / H82 / ATCC MYA-2454 / RMSCC 2432) TaxID=447093 RepID=C0NCA4_AJECG|nr:uncharacterized protein HCBG_00750 [Histoplasma capsulatum G186AR]EEH11295.1 predicted protein [Histoplasma capsulatum G186AR]